ncbi:hypothetical protein PILCRDRAFT_810556 [Piloderma croceum F 1598]|uniref:Uncharacterized protein n=1 Tax=Piloderma croceum (strain F 1598) TaxID=765440 RepID=A0A0C3CNJ1_PILCF|nr:hypothetical protein PILCRDRAFT_810556 [Piloderma croceum F 1598]
MSRIRLLVSPCAVNQKGRPQKGHPMNAFAVTETESAENPTYKYKAMIICACSDYRYRLHR